jgi:hypothetical protein
LLRMIFLADGGMPNVSTTAEAASRTISTVRYSLFVFFSRLKLLLHA